MPVRTLGGMAALLAALAGCGQSVGGADVVARDVSADVAVQFDAPDAPDALELPDAAPPAMDAREPLDAPAAPDVVSSCTAPRMCAGSGIPDEVFSGNCPLPDGGVTIELVSASLAFCHCVHGAAPGLEGYLSLRVHNASARDAVVGPDVALGLSAVDTGRPVALGPCCTHALTREYGCTGDVTVWSGRIEATRFDRLTAVFHVDSDTVTAGDYHASLTLAVDGVARTVDLGAVAVGAR